MLMSMIETVEGMSEEDSTKREHGCARCRAKQHQLLIYILLSIVVNVDGGGGAKLGNVSSRHA